MNFWLDLSRRCNEPELMDQFDSNQQQLWLSLEQFSAINRFITPCRGLQRRFFLQVMLRDPAREWTLLDVGAGAGDVPMWLTQVCQQHNINVRITCVDHDPRVVEFAENNCREYSNIEVVEADVLSLADDGRKWDFVFANHFLHHLSDEQIVAALKVIQSVCTDTYVLSDIWRSYTSYYGFTVLAAIWFRGSFCYDDGRLSVRKSFRKKELSAYLASAGIAATSRVHWCLPGHLAIVGTGL